MSLPAEARPKTSFRETWQGIEARVALARAETDGRFGAWKPEAIGAGIGIVACLALLRFPLPDFLRHRSPEWVCWRVALGLAVLEAMVVGVALLARAGRIELSGLKATPAFALVIARAALPVLAFTIASLPAANAWTETRGGYFAIGGLLPWSDASNYYAGAVDISAYGRMDDWNKRRPVNAAVNSLKLAAGRGLRGWIAINAILIGSALLLAAREVSLRAGYCAAAAFMATVGGHAPGFWATTMSETNGHFFGLLALTILLAAIRLRSARRVLAGIFVLTIALDARAGAFLVLPLAWIWVALAFGHGWRGRVKLIVAALLVSVVGFLPAKLYTALWAEGATASHANFSWTLYGLAKGDVGWQRVFTDYPEISKMSERQRSDFVMKRALELISRDPEKFARLIVGKLVVFTRQLDAYVNVSFIAAGLAFLLWCWRPRHSTLGLVVVALAGTIASAPILMRDGGPRVFASTVPLVALTTAILTGAAMTTLTYLLAKAAAPDTDHQLPASPGLSEHWSVWPSTLGFAIVICSLVVPLGFALPSGTEELPSLPTTRSVLRFTPSRSGEWVDTLARGTGASSRLPVVPLGNLVDDLQTTQMSGVELTSPPMSFGVAVGPRRHPDNGDPLTWFVTPTGVLLPRARKPLVLGGTERWTANGMRYLVVDEVLVLAPDGRKWVRFGSPPTNRIE